jgi:guanosine-3',5'-bis(diphosphate) 3'-pyrophosphohydrolase
VKDTDVYRALRFAADRHSEQRRKGSRAEPYVNHLIEVIWLLSDFAGITDPILLSAAALHDVVEDTPTTFAELEREFGAAVTRIVAEVTDDKSLSKGERKEQQVIRVANATPDVKLLKLADHAGNVATLPDLWTVERRMEFLEWSDRVTRHCLGIRIKLDAEYHRRFRISQKILEE